MGHATAEGRRIRIRGVVQGVGFRPWVYRTAIWSGVTGRVLNDSSGVVIDAFGDAPSLERFERALHVSPPPAARITEYTTSIIQPEPATAFVIIDSQRSGDRLVSIPPDLAVCDDCVREIFDPHDRRYRYAFTNCTNCGPRFTIATDIPYDRVSTTMAPFEMCDACRHEYENVRDRRFHAQPVACPECGPRVVLRDAAGRPYPFEGVAPAGASADDIAQAAAALRAGLIVAVKGLGGYHLACDATSESAVVRLRARKHREEKPLAVMVRTLGDVSAIATPTDEESRLLTSAERPIVLLAKARSSRLAASVAPRNRQVGVMLAYTPLHHLLLADAGVPLVMTSGNLSDEPIAFDNDDALQRLRGIADLFLTHDREIASRCDDSVAAVIGGGATLLRRSRGYVPRVIHLSAPVSRPVLACGALLKNTFCLAEGEHAYLGPHIGDLENLETYDAFTDAIERFERFLQIRPEVIAHDLHPDYLSTRFARSLPARMTVAVQHHHAHVVSVMAEHHLAGPVIGIAYDGTGYGLDGTSWGGEVMIATAESFHRCGTFRAIPLIGGDQAIREPWRIAFALAYDAFDGDVPPYVWSTMPAISARDVADMTQLIRADVQISPARGVGRYFDGFAAMFLNRRRAAFEGQLALEWNQIADPSVGAAYPFEVNDAVEPSVIDLRPAFRAAVQDARAGLSAAAIAGAFHSTLAEATAALVRIAAAKAGKLPVVAGGGCFQNALLAARVRRALRGFDVRLAEQAPPGDGGIALGQAVAADRIARISGQS
jgi:hydrogenase maturation protein HypF